MTDKLPHVLEILLNSMKLRYSYALPDTFKKCLLNSIQEYVTKLLNLHDIAENDSCDDLIQHVNGLILLKQCNMLDQTILKTSAFANAERTVDQIFRFLVSERIGELACRDLSMRMIEYLRALMEFQFSLLSSTIIGILSMTKKLEELITKDTPVTSVDCTIITHGEHFLNTFKSVIFKYMLTHESTITIVCDDMWRNNSSFLLKWIEDLLLFLKRHRRELQVHVDAIIDIILQKFTCLNNAVFDVDSRKERLINIYSIAVHLKSKPTEATQKHEFYQWIRDQLTNNNDLEYKTKILKHFFVCLTDVTDHVDLQISLRTLRIDDRFPCSDLSETSVNAMKVDCFETLLVLLSTTKSMLMLKCMIHIAAGAGNRLINEKLEEYLRGYYYGASLEHVLESLQQTYDAFMETNSTSETERLDILRGFLLPAFKFCDAIAIERFFEKNILHLEETVTREIVDDDDAIKQIIVSKIGCFQLIAIMFARVDENKIDANGTIARNKLDQILIDRSRYRKLFYSTRDTRSLRITRPGCQELVRLLHCYAYNCSLAILSLKKEEHFYSSAFGEDNKKGFFIWKNIIDCGTQYKFGQTFKEYPKTREVTVNIRSAEIDRDGRQTHKYTYVHSYDLSACTLSEDINAYDLNKCVVLPSDFRRSASTMNSVDSDPLRTHGVTSIALNSNDFNEHECMPYICVLLRHIKKIFGLSDKEPDWLRYFLNIMQCDNQNIQLFMLKVISNTADEVFKPYAKFALTQIINAIAKYLQRYDLNYIITDVLEILMDWHDVAMPSNKDGKAAAQTLFEVLINKILIRRSGDNQRVYNYNLGLMKTIVEKWRSCLRVPSDFLNQKIISADTTAVYLILVLLDNDMTEEIVVRNDIVDFLLKPLNDWNSSEKETPLQCCECLGLYLRSLDNDRHDETERENRKHEVKQKIFAILGSTNPRHMMKQIKCIAVLCRTYPEVAMDYINVTIIAMSNGLARSYCLEIFTLVMPKLSAKEVVNNLHHMELQRILTNRVPSCEKMALQIVRDMVAIVLPINLEHYVNLAIPYIKDNITEHRELVYDILMKIYKRWTSADNDMTVQNLLSISKQNLLAGLLDPSHDLQDRILKFWMEETSLGTERSKDWLIALLAMHSPRMTMEVDAFATFVALLMLQLTTRSIYYTSKMFDTPLQDSCTFEKYSIPVSWRRRNLNCVTPMFIDSLASQLSYSTFSQSVDYNDLRGTYMTPTFSYPRLSHGVHPRLRATQDLQFEPTLLDDDDAADNVTLDISSRDTEFDRTAIPSTSRQSLQTASSQRRFTRILANTSDVANINRHEQIRKNVQRAERIKQENVRQRSSVKLYR